MPKVSLDLFKDFGDFLAILYIVLFYMGNSNSVGFKKVKKVKESVHAHSAFSPRKRHRVSPSSCAWPHIQSCPLAQQRCKNKNDIMKR